MFNRIVSDTLEYFKLFNFLDFFLQIIYLIYMNKPELALDYLQWLMCHKTNPNQSNFEIK